MAPLPFLLVRAGGNKQHHAAGRRSRRSPPRHSWLLERGSAASRWLANLLLM